MRFLRWCLGLASSPKLTQVQANCANDGLIALIAPDITIVYDQAGRVTSYAFSCPKCQLWQTNSFSDDKRPTQRMINLLVEQGAQQYSGNQRAGFGLPLSTDEILDYQLRLQQPGWLEESIGKLDP